MEIRIPFGGFYHSNFESNIESSIEALAETYSEGFPTLPMEEVVDAVNTAVDYRLLFAKLARQHHKRYWEAVFNQHGVYVKGVFGTLWQPKEYNFETDRIVSNITLIEAAMLRDLVSDEALDKTAKDLFTTRSGFVSYYSPNWREWGTLENWSPAQLYALLVALDVDINAIEIEIELDVNTEELTSILEDKVFILSTDQSDRKFPPPSCKDVKTYVERFNVLNGLKS